MLAPRRQLDKSTKKV